MRLSSAPMTDRLRLLALQFPTLRRAPLGDVADLAVWLKGPVPGSGATQAGLFVLSVWAGSSEGPEGWGLPRFDAMRAIGAWDETHRQVFAEWCRSPWWC